jgi:hypothetical protein
VAALELASQDRGTRGGTEAHLFYRKVWSKATIYMTAHEYRTALYLNLELVYGYPIFRGRQYILYSSLDNQDNQDHAVKPGVVQARGLPIGIFFFWGFGRIARPGFAVLRQVHFHPTCNRLAPSDLSPHREL